MGQQQNISTKFMRKKAKWDIKQKIHFVYRFEPSPSYTSFIHSFFFRFICIEKKDLKGRNDANIVSQEVDEEETSVTGCGKKYHNDSKSCPKSSLSRIFFKKCHLSNVAKYFGYFCQKICSQDLSKVAQSGHTGRYVH